MRFITTPSYYPYYVAACVALVAALLCLPSGAQASTTIIPSDGCFLRSAVTLYLTEPTCSASLENNSAIADTITLELVNLDPDSVVFSGATTTIISRTKNSLTVDITVPAGDTVYTIAPWYNVGDDFYFVALSDNQARGTVETNPIFEDVLSQVGVINPPFFTNSGDLVQGSDDTATLNDMFTAVQNSLTTESVPMYPVAGNHDYDPELATYRNFFGGLDYTYEVGSAHFVNLSTAADASKASVSSDQLTWLQTALAQTAQPHTVLLFHHPVSIPTWSNPTCCYTTTSERDALAQVIDQGSVDLVISGHTQGYDYRYITSADIPTVQTGFYQLVTGGAGGNIAQPQGDYHFTLAHVTNHGIEHQIIPESDFGLALEYDDNNGSKTQAYATIENSSAIDLPYIRLKFRLRTTATSFLIQDETGQYYNDYQSHAYDDYTVVYVTMNLPAHTTRTITIAPAKLIHTAVTQTITPEGFVSYSATPTTTATATNLMVRPVETSTTLTHVTSSVRLLTWTETPGEAETDTTYTITDLAPNTWVQVAVNGKIIHRLLANDQGTVRFTYHDTMVERHFALHFFTEPAATLATLPVEYGTVQVRFFSKRGTVLGQWSAFDGALVNDTVMRRGDLTGDGTDEIVLYQPSAATANVRIYSLGGNELARFSLSTAPLLADLTNDEVMDIVNTQAGVKKLNIITYDTTSAAFTTQTLTWPSSLSKASQLVAIADVTNDGSDEVMLYDQSAQRLTAFSYQNEILTAVRSYRFPKSTTIQKVVTGYFQRSDQVALAVLGQQASGEQTVWYLAPHGARHWRGVFSQRYSTPTITDIVATALRPHQLDRLVATTVTGKLITYRVQLNRWQPESAVLLSESTTAQAWNIGLLNGGRRWPVRVVTTNQRAPGDIIVWEYESATHQLKARSTWYGYGENFPGGTLFAGKQ